MSSFAIAWHSEPGSQRCLHSRSSGERFNRGEDIASGAHRTSTTLPSFLPPFFPSSVYRHLGLFSSISRRSRWPFLSVFFFFKPSTWVYSSYREDIKKIAECISKSTFVMFFFFRRSEVHWPKFIGENLSPRYRAGAMYTLERAAPWKIEQNVFSVGKNQTKWGA